MNRNTMYDYLESKGMKPIFIHRKKAYHTEFRLDKNQGDCWIYTDWGYIRHVFSIHLCMNEIVVESKLDMKVNIKYSSMKKFEVYIEEVD